MKRSTLILDHSRPRISASQAAAVIRHVVTSKLKILWMSQAVRRGPRADPEEFEIDAGGYQIVFRIRLDDHVECRAIVTPKKSEYNQLTDFDFPVSELLSEKEMLWIHGLVFSKEKATLGVRQVWQVVIDPGTDRESIVGGRFCKGLGKTGIEFPKALHDRDFKSEEEALIVLEKTRKYFIDIQKKIETASKTKSKKKTQEHD